jgi:hypothetical protein
MNDFQKPRCPACGAYPPPCPFEGMEDCRQEEARDYTDQELALLRMEQEASGNERG